MYPSDVLRNDLHLRAFAHGGLEALESRRGSRPVIAAPALTAGRPGAVPVPVRLALAAWLTALAAGVAEALMLIGSPDPPTPGQLAVRFAVYTGIAALVLALRTGRNAVR